jgi:hypothetical protein
MPIGSHSCIKIRLTPASPRAFHQRCQSSRPTASSCQVLASDDTPSSGDIRGYWPRRASRLSRCSPLSKAALGATRGKALHLSWGFWPAVVVAREALVNDPISQSQPGVLTDSGKRGRRCRIAVLRPVQPHNGFHCGCIFGCPGEVRELERNAEAWTAAPAVHLRESSPPPVDGHAAIMAAPAPSEGRQRRGTSSGIRAADRQYGRNQRQCENPTAHGDTSIGSSRGARQDKLSAREPQLARFWGTLLNNGPTHDLRSPTHTPDGSARQDAHPAPGTVFTVPVASAPPATILASKEAVPVHV